MANPRLTADQLTRAHVILAEARARLAAESGGDALPLKNVVLDRFEAVQGYTVENTRPIHTECDLREQSAKGFR